MDAVFAETVFYIPDIEDLTVDANLVSDYTGIVVIFAIQRSVKSRF